MAVKWTPEQTKVIELHDRNILVSAAAGSGKTAVLVERIVKMVENGCDIDRLLVVTFTNAAAMEMRERLREAIEKRIEASPDNQHLHKQLLLISSAMICTIDSFCLDLVKNNFTGLSIDPCFKIADEAELKLIKADVMNQLLEDRYKTKDKRFREFVYNYSSGKKDKDIDEIIYKLHTFAGAYPYPNKWLDECVKAYREDITLNRITENMLENVKSIVRTKLSALEENTKAIMDKEGKDKDAVLVSNKEVIQYAYELLNAPDYESLYKLVKSSFKPPRRDNKKGTHEEFKDDIIAFKKMLEKIQEKYFFQNVADMKADILNVADTIELIVELVKEFDERLKNAKSEKNIVDFNDVEHMALELLVKEDGYTELADMLSEHYEEILIDEYQDSNYLQEFIMKSISRERKGNPNVFMVGDVKQSIYKFRLAKPELFMEKYDTYSEEDSKYQKIELHNNFRSRACVLNSVNDIFYMVMKKNVGNIEYDEKVALNPTAHFEDTKLNIATDTKVMVAVGDEEKKELEAAMVANEILFLTDPVNGINIWDKHLGEYRIAKYSDIVILLRSTSAYSEAFLEGLKTRNIPVILDSSTAYFEAKEVVDVLNMLKIIDNPRQDIPLAAAMMSYFGEFNVKEMSIIRAGNKHVSFYEALKQYEADETIVLKKNAFLEQLDKYRKRAVYLSARELIRELVYNTGYYAHVANNGLGKQRQLNLDMLIQTAKQFEATSYAGIFNFLRYVEKVKEYDIDLGNSNSTVENNAVRIMTIHKSKGLEFPIVFASGLGKNINRKDSQGKIIVDSEFGVGIDYIDKNTREKTATLGKNIIADRIIRENIAEELRLLYVALTRAKEKLIMTGCVSDCIDAMVKWESFDDSYVLNCKSHLDMVMPAVVKGGFDFVTYTKEDIYNIDSRAENDDVVTKEAVLYDESLMNTPYPFEKAINLNSKMTVTEIKKMAHSIDDEDTFSILEPEITPIVPKFIANEEKLDSAAMGTLYHKVMECIDYGENIENELDRMVQKGYISKEDKLLIDVKKIEAFMATKEATEIKEAFEKGELFREKQFILGVNATSISPEYEGIDETILVQGVIDMYYYYNDELVLLDYKTDRVRHYDNPKGLLIERYKKQLDYYKEALERLLQRKVNRMYIYSFDLNEMIEYKEN